MCDQENTFNKTDAEVVCYQLGLSGDIGIKTNFHCDSSDLDVLELAEFNDVSCTGREEKLINCSIAKGLSDCTVVGYICVQCPSEFTTALQGEKGSFLY